MTKNWLLDYVAHRGYKPGLCNVYKSMDFGLDSVGLHMVPCGTCVFEEVFHTSVCVSLLS